MANAKKISWRIGAKTMENDAAMLYCPNDLCQAANPITNKFCQQCRTRLWKRYLWAVADDGSVGLPVDSLGDRYLVLKDGVVLDTKPSLLPESPVANISQLIRPYLRLISWRLHLPQAYGVVLSVAGKSTKEVLLLEQAPIYPDGSDKEGQLLPELTAVGGNASSMRQLNWLWQMASLWQPLKSEGVASSLLDTQLLRVEGSLVRLLQLHADQKPAPTLADLGKLWLGWLPWIKAAIAPFLQQLCQELIEGKIHSSEQLIAVLDRAATEVGQAQKSKIYIATNSDTGPHRARNEDACYPPSGTSITKPPHPEALVIVCDGIGGHEGGNVASNLAIQTIQEQVQKLTKLSPENLDPTTVLTELEGAVANANDRISSANDREHKQGRQRMGTTLVMGLAVAHQMYIAHVGDSRAYLITRQACHQITLDDDVASREVRLGYAMYRDAVQQISSGSLVQALGMNPSNALHPTSGRFILDDSCVFLLTSDGLSDFDRVEQYWETEILPILEGKIDLATATGRLVDIANTLNGHDNVTVGLVHFQIQSSEPQTALPPSMAVWESTTSNAPTLAVENKYPTPSSPVFTAATQILPAKSKKRKLPWLLGLLLLLGIGGGVLAYLWKPELIPLTIVSAPKSSEPTSNPNVAAAPSAAQAPTETQTADQSTASFLEPGSLIRSQGEIVFSEQDLPPKEASSPTAPESVIQGSLPAGSVLQVITKQPISNQDQWLQLKVCETPLASAVTTAPTTPTIRQLQPGEQGWIKLSAVQPLIAANWQPAAENSCPAIIVKPKPVTSPAVQSPLPTAAPPVGKPLKRESTPSGNSTGSKTR